MNIEKFIADKITGNSKTDANISKPIVKIGILGIILGLAVILLTVSIVYGFKNEIIRKLTSLTSEVVISSNSYGSNGEQVPIKISKDTLSALTKINGVENVCAIANKNGIVKTKSENEGIVIRGVDANYNFLSVKNSLIEGVLPSLNDSVSGNDILISEYLAKRLGLGVGDKFLVYFIVQKEIIDSAENVQYVKFEPRSRNFKICGIFTPSFGELDNFLVFADIRHIQKLNYWDAETVGSYEIHLSNFSNLDLVSENIEDYIGYNYRVVKVNEMFSNIFSWLEKLDINGIIIIIMMVVVAVINMITALLILILERANMIGIVKSLGMSNASVRKIFFYISIKLLGRGLLWGNIFGIGLCLVQYYFEPFKLDSSTYYVDHVAIELNWLNYFLLNIGTASICLLMLFIPTIILTKITPIKTLRFD
ncbi:MAG: ABC transporter permease [Bacteroidia bacterium]